MEIWYTGVRKITKMRMIAKFSLILVHLITLPLTSIVYLMAPKSRVKQIKTGFYYYIQYNYVQKFNFFLLKNRQKQIGKFLSLPCVKFISHFASYLIFISMIVASNLGSSYDEMSLIQFSIEYGAENFSYYTSYINKTSLNPPLFRDFLIRPSQPNGIDIVISIWIIGKLVLLTRFTNYPHQVNFLTNNKKN